VVAVVVRGRSRTAGGELAVLAKRIDHHLRILAEEIGARPPGSAANHRATTHVATTLEQAGLSVRCDPFWTRWWEPGPGQLCVDGRDLTVVPNPFSPPCDVQGSVVTVADLPALERLADGPGGRIVVLTGALAHEPLWPVAFPFLAVPTHRAIAASLLGARPAAVIAVSDHWQPILEDPDLGVPSTTIRTADAAGLITGVEVALRLGGAVHRGDGVNVAARTEGEGPRVVLSAHVDSKVTTPGAFDNAGGVAVLLALAEHGLPVDVPVEVVTFNGEDHADACGEVAWLAATDLSEIAGIVNIDGAGLRGHGSSLALMACPPELHDRVAAVVAGRPGWGLSEPWYESDHAILAMRGIPAVAVTTAGVHELMTLLAHSAADTVEVVDVEVLADVANTVATLLPVMAGR
jgi:aminopeptidase YwaD